MAKTINQVVIATDTFSSLITKTNQVISALSSEVVTANSSNDGANTSGNAMFLGIFSANTIAVSTGLRGGAVNAAANLAIVSNANFTGANTSFQSNVVITNSATSINSVATYVTGPTLTINSNTIISGAGGGGSLSMLSGTFANLNGTVAIGGPSTIITSPTTTISGNTLSVNSHSFNVTANAVSFQSNATFDGTLTITNKVTLNDDINYGPDAILGKQTSVINTDLGSTTGSPIIIYQWAKADYSSAAINTVVKNGTTARASMVLALTNGTDAYLTEYSTLHAPAGANLGIFSIGTNGANVAIRFTQTAPNSLVNLNITLTA